MNNEDENWLHEKSRELIDAFAEHLPQDEAEQLREYEDVGELGLFAESLCAALIQDRIPVTSEQRGILARMLDLMHADDQAREPYLTSRAQTVLALNVVD